MPLKLCKDFFFSPFISKFTDSDFLGLECTELMLNGSSSPLPSLLALLILSFLLSINPRQHIPSQTTRQTRCLTDWTYLDDTFARIRFLRSYWSYRTPRYVEFALLHQPLVSFCYTWASFFSADSLCFLLYEQIAAHTLKTQSQDISDA
jgi:hypothetical protein